ncbi:MAG: hypothetical protein US70_C0024G0015 [Parcubacteria group bacterium GW2011_GWD2_38_11]|nr:MAG: hypothetical protein US70_C0024G0015 [Parcubacteria group bacterium GW2011_GWD2_38_11]
MNQKSIIAILGVVVVILIGTTVYFATLNKVSQPVATAPNVQADNRILLTPQNTSQYFTGTSTDCKETFNFEPADINILYTDDTRGLSFDVPFNKNWGNKKYKFNSFDLENDGLSFGPASLFEGCSVIRSYSLKFKPAQSVEKAIAEIEKGITPITTKIDDLTVIKYVQADMCTNSFIEVIGKKYNYLFSTSCGVDATKDTQYLEDVVKSLTIK